MFRFSFSISSPALFFATRVGTDASKRMMVLCSQLWQRLMHGLMHVQATNLYRRLVLRNESVALLREQPMYSTTMYLCSR